METQGPFHKRSIFDTAITYYTVNKFCVLGPFGRYPVYRQAVL
ncbi:hypothetical protein ABIA00_001659 [Bradyrhizobium ottawaense]